MLAGRSAAGREHLARHPHDGRERVPAHHAGRGGHLLVAGSLSFRWTPGALGEIVDAAGKVVATAGEDITLFGGMGSDGGLVVCGLEET